ncbi:helix-turn-helix domain-containing protein [uncultured Jatrophihabitans sp.]|uniref:nSTAND1 domain-containing NTPase n=1 Tax=uncultured Jatrophihabitans sp. TaxID=1610747 RepID=UPI0035CA0F4F
MGDVVDPTAIRTRADFGAGLNALRDAAGFTVRDLAKQIGRPAGTLGDYLRGRHVPSPAQQTLIVDVLTACGVDDPAEIDAWLAALRRARASSDRRKNRTVAPYRGLKPFEPEDAALFFGRREQTDEIVQLVARLRSERGPSHGILAVIGPSGSGKSSLLRAGVMATVRAGALDNGDGDGDDGDGDGDGDGDDGDDMEWTCALATPGNQPQAAIATALAARGAGPHLVVLDQLEEIFTLTQDAAARSAFLDSLASSGPDVVVALGMRADFFAEAAREPVLLAALRHAQVVVGPLAAEQLQEVVLGPARQIGLAVEDGLVELVLADLGPHHAGALPLLSHALLATWDRSNGRRLTIADYRATGGLDAAVQRTAEEVFTSLDPSQQEGAHDLFARLVNVGDDVATTRRRISRSELGLDVQDAGHDAIRDIVDRFAARRLLTLTEDSVEVSHEALLTAWPRLRGWLDTDRAGLLVHRRITTGANAWDAGGRDPATLPHGSTLDIAAEWAAEPRNRRRMNAVEVSYLDAGVRRREELAQAARRRSRRLVQLLAAVAVLALVATGLAIWARTSQRTADHERRVATAARDDALSRQVAFQARQLNGSDPALAQQLALAAYRIAPSNVAKAAMADESATPVITRVLGPLGPTPLALAPARHLVAVGHADGTVHLFGLRSGAPPQRLATLATPPGDDQVFGLAFSPDGRLLATGGESHLITLWDVADPRHPRVRASFDPHFDGDVQSIALSADGHTLVASSRGRAPVERWDIHDPDHPVPLPPPHGVPATVTVNDVAYSADGHELADAEDDGTTLVWRAAGAQWTTARHIATGTANVSTVAFLPAAHDILLGARDGSVQIWSDTAVPHRLRRLTGSTNAIPTAIAVRPDQREIAVGYSDGTLRTWAVGGWVPLSSLANPGPVTGAAFSADSGTLLSTAADGTLRLVSAGSRAIPVAGTVFGMGYTARGSTLAIGDNGTPAGVRLWDVADPGAPHPLTPLLTMPAGTPASDGTAAVRRDGSLVATGNRNGQVELWDTRDAAHTRAAVAPFVAATALVEGLQFSPDGRLLAVAADDGNVSLWDVADPAAPRVLTRLHGASLMLNVAFSPDGRLVAGASADDTVYLWDVSDPTSAHRVARLRGFASYVYGVAFAPDSSLLAASSSDHTTRVWDVSAPTHPTLRAGPLIGPTGYALSAAFAPNGHDLAIGSDDDSVRIFDLRNHRDVPTQTLTALPGAVWSLAFSPSGRTLVAAGRAPNVVFWSTDYAGYADRLCPLAGTTITRQEWSLYVPGARYDPPCR